MGWAPPSLNATQNLVIPDPSPSPPSMGSAALDASVPTQETPLLHVALVDPTGGDCPASLLAGKCATNMPSSAAPDGIPSSPRTHAPEACPIDPSATTVPDMLAVSPSPAPAIMSSQIRWSCYPVHVHGRLHSVVEQLPRIRRATAPPLIRSL